MVVRSPIETWSEPSLSGARDQGPQSPARLKAGRFLPPSTIASAMPFQCSLKSERILIEAENRIAGEHAVLVDPLDHNEMLEALEVHQHDRRALHLLELVDGEPEAFGAKATRGEIGFHVEHREADLADASRSPFSHIARKGVVSDVGSP